MRAKIKNDLVALGLLLRIVSRSFKDLIDTFNQSEVLVIPAPPSFWGRLQGKFDIAQMASLTLFPNAEVFLGVLPGAFWRRKRAGRNSSISINSKSRVNFFGDFMNSIDRHDLLDKISQAKRILVVDDVMTTGLTMRTIVNQLIELGAQSIGGLVMASTSHDENESMDGPGATIEP